MDTSRDMIVDSHSNKSQHHRYHLKLYCFYVCVRNSLSEKQPVVRIIPQVPILKRLFYLSKVATPRVL